MAALLDRIVAGSTDQSVTIRIISTTSSPVGLPREDVTEASGGLALWYRRDGAAKQAITPIVAGSLTAHSDGGIIHVDDGEYELDVPDAAFAAGADRVTIGGTVTDGIIIGGQIELLPGDKDTFTRQQQTNYRLQLDGSRSAPTFQDASNFLVTTDILSSGAENQINAQLDTAIEDYRLDELVLIAAGTPTSGSLWSDLIASQTTASAFVDLIWVEPIADHSGVSGSMAEALNTVMASNDPWTTTLPGAYTGSQAGKILADVLADTGELQTNQGNWLTATGFSTHSAADVFGVFTTGGNEENFKADVSALATAASISALNDIAVADIWNYATSMLVDTNSIGYQLTTNLNATVSSRSSHSAADVYTEFTSGSNEDVFKANVSGLSTFDPTTDQVSVNRVLNTTLTETTAGNLAANFSTFYDNNDSLTIKVVDSVGTGVGGGGDDAATIYSYFTTAGRQDTFKATGFSTHNAGDVYTMFTSGNNEDVFKADVSALATTAALATVDTEVGLIKAKTDQLQFSVPGQVDANALTGGGGDDAATIYTYFTSLSREVPFQATGFSTHSAADVYTVFTTASNEDVFKADVSALSTQVSVDSLTSIVSGLNNISAADVYTEFTSGSNEDAFKADVALLPTLQTLMNTLTVLVNELRGSGFVEATDSNEAIRNQGDANWSGGSGGNIGTHNYTETLVNSISSAPLEGATVFYTAPGNSTIIGETVTNSLGQFTLYANSSGPWTVGYYKRGFVDGTIENVTFTENS